MTNKLKNCPWCRIEPSVSKDEDNDLYYIKCFEVSCSMNPESYWTDDLESLVKNWNKMELK